MNSIWNNLYDRVKDRRYGALFTVSAVASVGVVFAGKGIEALVESVGWQPFLAGFFALCLAMAWRMWRLSRMPRERTRFEPLSCDEMRKARSKLMRSQKVG